MIRRRTGRRRSAGQSLVEMAVIAPALVTLAAGAGQVGVLAYGSVSVDTAARAAARIASEYPDKSLDFKSSLGISTYTCGQASSDSATESSVCSAARSAAGLLPGAQLVVSVSVSTSISQAPAPGDVVQVGNTCPGGALEVGKVDSLPNGTVAAISSPSKATVGTVTTDSQGNYSICLSSPSTSQGDQKSSITATAVDATGCVYSTSLSIVVHTDGTVTPTPGDMTLPSTGVCPTSSSSTTTTSTSTTLSLSLSTTTTVWAPGPIPTPVPVVSCSTIVPDTSYVLVTVSYKVPVFAPFVGRFFESPAGSGGRTVTATQRMQIEPCSITQGG